MNKEKEGVELMKNKNKLSDAKIIICLATDFDGENTEYESYSTSNITRFSLEKFEKILDDIKPTTKRLSDFKKKAWKVFP